VVIAGQRLKSREEAPLVEVPDAVERGDRRWTARLRAAGLLALLLTGLGVAAAAVIGATAIGIATLIDQALG
jgi:hypothetical protein